MLPKNPREDSRSERPLPPLSDVVEDLGVGLAQVKAMMFGGGVWLADGAELLLIGSVTRALATEWHLGPAARSSVVGVVFCGVLFGNILSGWIGDSAGRWLAIVVSYLTVGVFSIFSALAQNVVMLATGRFFVGCAFGMGQPAWNALHSELTPSGFRMEMQAASQFLFTAGELYAAWLIWMDDPTMQHMDWRRLMVFGAIPSLVLAGCAMVFLQESPHFLSLIGRQDLAKQVLADMRRDNRCEHIPIDFKPPDVINNKRGDCGASMLDQLNVVFGRRMLPSTLIISFTCFSVNFLLYGGIYALPQVLPHINVGNISPAATLFIAAVFEIPGVFLAMCLSCVMDRRPSIAISLMLASVSLLLFAWAGTQSSQTPGVVLSLQIGLIGMKSMTFTVFILAYQVAAEIFPTTARATGNAIVLATGRIGAITCPFFYEFLQDATGSFSAFFTLMAFLCAANAFLIKFIPETKGMRLSYTEGDMLVA